MRIFLLCRDGDAQCKLCSWQPGAAFGGGGGDEGAFFAIGYFSRSSRYLELSASGVTGTPGVLRGCIINPWSCVDICMTRR